MEKHERREIIDHVEILNSTYISKVKSLEKTLFTFYEQFQNTIAKIYELEVEAIQYIHQLDNHLDQLRICQKVDVKDLPTSLDHRLKNRLLTKLYWKILHYIGKLKCNLEWCKKETEKVSSLSFDCICVANEVPPTFMSLIATNGSEIQSAEPGNVFNDKSIVSNDSNQSDIREPTAKRLSLIELLEWTPKLHLMLCQYVCQMEKGLDCLPPGPLGDQHGVSNRCNAADEGPLRIQELFPFPEEAEDHVGEDFLDSKTCDDDRLGHIDEVGSLAYLILKQSLSDTTDNANENIDCETKQGKQLIDAYKFSRPHKIEIQQIMFETSFFRNKFKGTKKLSKKEESLKHSQLTTPSKSSVNISFV